MADFCRTCNKPLENTEQMQVHRNLHKISTKREKPHGFSPHKSMKGKKGIVRGEPLPKGKRHAEKADESKGHTEKAEEEETHQSSTNL